MPLTPAINATVKITTADINGNRTPKQFSFVQTLSFDFFKGQVMINDAVQGQFYFSLSLITSLTYTIVTGTGGSTTVVMF